MSFADQSDFPSPAKDPFAAHEEEIHDWTYRRPIDQIKWSQEHLDPAAFVGETLGPPTRCEDQWQVWEDPVYVLYAHPDGHLDLGVPEGVHPQQTSEAVLWDFGCIPRELTRAEHAEQVAVGQALAEPHVEDFPDYTQEQLKRFVLDYCDGRLYCNHQCAPNDLAMVFMPLAFGALDTQGPDEEKDTGGSPAWHAEQNLPPHPGNEPQPEAKPDAPERSADPERPAEPVWKAVDPQVVEDLARQNDDPDVEVQVVTDLFIAGPSLAAGKYEEGIASKNEALRFEHETALVQWEAAKVQLDKDHEAALEAHKVALADHEAREAALEDRVAQWRREVAVHSAARQGFGATRLKNLGVIFEEISKAGPRSVNGQPIFWSLRIINHSDWKRAYAAIARELERRESMEI